MSVASHVPSEGTGQAADLASATESYRRLATMDPPALHSLVTELTRISRDSAASAAQQATAEATARADQNAQRATAAQAALNSLEAQGRCEGSR